MRCHFAGSTPHQHHVFIVCIHSFAVASIRVCLCFSRQMVNTSRPIVMIYLPSSSPYHPPAILGTRRYLELKMNKSTRSLHKECFNNSPNRTTSSLWSSLGLRLTVRNQGPGPGWVQGESPRNPFIPGGSGQSFLNMGRKENHVKWRQEEEGMKNPQARRGTLEGLHACLIPCDTPSSSRRVAGPHSATSMPPCGEKAGFLLPT